MRSCKLDDYDMRILVVADIHANWPALQAIREEFDACFMLGDIVDYGTNPGACVDWVREHATHMVRGNHDHAVSQGVTARPGTGLKGLAAVTRPMQRANLDRSQIKFLARLPVTAQFRLDNVDYLLVHATPRDPLDEYLGNDPAEWAEVLENVDADIVCVGHTHCPLDLSVNGKRVINPGSVGQPRDGDPRCSYAIIENGRVDFRRIPYDIDATISQARSVGLDPWALELTESILKSGCR